MKSSQIFDRACAILSFVCVGLAIGNLVWSDGDMVYTFVSGTFVFAFLRHALKEF